MAGRGGGKNLSYDDSVTLSQSTDNLLLKAQGERLNPAPPHFRNPRGQASPTTPPFRRLGSQNQILPSCKHSLLMLQEHQHVAETISGRFVCNPSNFSSNFSSRHHLSGPSCPPLLAEGSHRASPAARVFLDTFVYNLKNPKTKKKTLLF